jgi:hypothetical protein
MSNKDELELTMENKTLTDITKRNYRAVYKRLRKVLNTDIINTTNKDILDAITDLSNSNYNSMYTYLNIAMIIKLHFDLNVEELEEQRQALIGLKKNLVKYQNEAILDKLPEYKDYVKFIKNLYDANQFEDFVINFLLLNYGVRNQDINVKLIDKKDFNNALMGNYLVVYKNKIVYHRTDYKTFLQYGMKHIEITNKNFIRAVSNLPIDKYLLGGRDTPMNISNLTSYIKTKTMRGLTQREIFKLIVNHIKTKPNFIQLLEFYSYNRGTNPQTIIDNYSHKTELPINDYLE